MFGDIAGCTQPSSNNILRACDVLGHTPAGCAAGTLFFKAEGNSGRTICPSFIAGLNNHLRGKNSFNVVLSTRSATGRRTCFSTK